MSRKYFPTPSVEGEKVVYRINCLDEWQGIMPEESVGEYTSRPEALAVAQQMTAAAEAVYPPRPAPIKQSTWWSS